MYRSSLLLTLTLLGGLAVAAESVPYGHGDFYPSAERPAGLQGDGSGQFPAATPVSAWDFTTRKNIVWAATLPSFGSSSPIVVGDKVFVTAEFNLLICLDARTGKTLWVRDVDTIPTVAGSKADEVRKEWNALWQQHAEGYAVCFEIAFLRYKLAAIEAAKSDGELVFPGSKEKRGRKIPGAFGPYPGKHGRPDPWLHEGYLTEAEKKQVLARLKGLSDAEVTAVRQRLAELVQLREEKMYEPQTSAYVPTGSPYKRGSKAEKAFKKRWRSVQGELQDDYGLVMEFWNGWMNAFPTPISDGEHVWVQFMHSQVACYDLEGNQVWLQVFPPEDPSEAGLTLGQNYAASPILAGDKLLTIFGGDRGTFMTVRCFDKASGKLLWAHKDVELSGGHSFNQIRRVKTDQVDVVVSGSGLAWNIADGKPVNERSLFQYSVPPPRVIGDTAHFFCSGSATGNHQTGAYAMRFTDPGTGPKAEFVWATLRKEVKKGKVDPTWQAFSELVPPTHLHDTGDKSLGKIRIPVLGGVVHDGTLWFLHKNTAFSLADGTPKTFKIEGPRIGSGGGHEIAAGDIVIQSAKKDGYAQYGIHKLGELGKRLRVNTLGSEVHRRVMLLELPVEEVLRMIREHHYDPKPGLINFSTPWPQGDRLYIRTRDSVFCIGDPKGSYHSPKGAPAAARTGK